MFRDRPDAGRIGNHGNHSDSFKNEYDWGLNYKARQ